MDLLFQKSSKSWSSNIKLTVQNITYSCLNEWNNEIMNYIGFEEIKWHRRPHSETVKPVRVVTEKSILKNPESILLQ